MTARSCAATLYRIAVLVCVLPGAAMAGTFDHGNWSPTGCGVEPVAPAGLNLSSGAAYTQSLKWVKAYQDAYQKFSDCMVKEANEDVDAINDYVRGRQLKAQAFFDKATEDSKHARSALGSGKSDDNSGNGPGDRRGRSGISVSGD